MSDEAWRQFVASVRMTPRKMDTPEEQEAADRMAAEMAERFPAEAEAHREEFERKLGHAIEGCFGAEETNSRLYPSPFPPGAKSESRSRWADAWFNSLEPEHKQAIQGHFEFVRQQDAKDRDRRDREASELAARLHAPRRPRRPDPATLLRRLKAKRDR